ncbi:chloride channel protein [Methylomonas methanica]
MFIPMGIVVGGLGVIFNFAVLRGQRLIQLSGPYQCTWWLVLTLIVATLAWIWLELLGGGQSLINNLLVDTDLGLQSVIGFWAIRFVLTIASASSGAAGGIFMPILALGGLLGWAAGLITHLLLPEFAVDMQLFVVIGMATYFSATVQAPLTGIVLLIEMTANYELILPLYIGCFTALLIASALRGEPIYNAMMKNSLRM